MNARLWAFLTAAGVLAGVATLLIGEFTYRAIVPASQTVHVMGIPVDHVPRADQVDAGIKNSMLTFGLLGAVLGLALGLASGLARRAPRSSGFAGLVGLALGAIVGALLSWILVPMFYRYEDMMEERISNAILVPLLIHAGLWGSLGAVGGLAAGLGLGGRNQVLRAVLGGLIGAWIGTALYELIGVFAFPMEQTTQPLSASFLTRALARMLVCVFTAIGVVLALTAETKKRPEPSLGP